MEKTNEINDHSTTPHKDEEGKDQRQPEGNAGISSRVPEEKKDEGGDTKGKEEKEDGKEKDDKRIGFGNIVRIRTSMVTDKSGKEVQIAVQSRLAERIVGAGDFGKFLRFTL